MALHSRKRFAEWPPAGFDGEFDWDFLLPAFAGTKIKPMDFDAVIERNGRFLIFETKAPGQEIDLGQKITLTAQWKLGACIFLVSGKRARTIDAMAEYQPGTWREGEMVGNKPLTDCNAGDLVFRTRRWFCWANNMQRPSREEWERDIQLFINNPETPNDLEKAKGDLRVLVTNRAWNIPCQRCLGAGCDHCGGKGVFTHKWWARPEQL